MTVIQKWQNSNIKYSIFTDLITKTNFDTTVTEMKYKIPIFLEFVKKTDFDRKTSTGVTKVKVI